MNIELQPFQTPNFVLSKAKPAAREEGFLAIPKWSLAEVDAESLSKLCDQFRADVFRKAGKKDPKA